MSRIAVLGATGKAGAYLVKELVRQGYEVKVLVRKVEGLEGVEGVIGDARNYDSVYQWISGCDAVMSTLGPRKGDGPAASEAAANIVMAMNAHGLKRYIQLTGITIDIPGDRKGFMTKLLTRMMRNSFPDVIADKQKDYSIISESGLDWTIVRVPWIKQNDDSHKLKINLTDRPGSKISTTDIAKFMVGQLSDTQFIRKAPFIAN